MSRGRGGSDPSGSDPPVEESIPLGTDLDPMHKCHKPRAAEQVSDPITKTLFTHDLARRILDAEYIGFT